MTVYASKKDREIAFLKSELNNFNDLVARLTAERDEDRELFTWVMVEKGGFTVEQFKEFREEFKGVKSANPTP